MDKKKAKGGAEKNREKKRLKLQFQASSCHNIQHLFTKVSNEKEKEVLNCDTDNVLLKV